MKSGSPYDSRPLPILDDEDIRPSKFVKLGLWLEDRWGQALSVMGGLILAGYQLAKADSFLEWFVFGIGAAAFLVGNIVLFQQAPSITKLKEKVTALRRRLKASDEANAQLAERAQLAYRQAVDPLLRGLAETLKFGETERISVYKDAGGLFSMLGRSSLNPRYDQQGRRSYPDSEGCIADAYLNGFAFDDNIPDPALSMSAYCDYMLKKWKIDISVCMGLRMRTRNIAASALYGPSSKKTIGVIVFESTKANKFTSAMIEGVLKAKETQEIGILAEQLQIDRTSIQTALEEEL